MVTFHGYLLSGLAEGVRCLEAGGGACKLVRSGAVLPRSKYVFEAFYFNGQVFGSHKVYNRFRAACIGVAVPILALAFLPQAFEFGPVVRMLGCL